MKRPKEHVEVTKKGSPLRHRIKAKEKIFLRHVTWPENIHRSNHEKRRGLLRDGSQLGTARKVQGETRHTSSPWTSTPPTEVAEVQVAGHFASLDPSPAGLLGVALDTTPINGLSCCVLSNWPYGLLYALIR